MKKICLLFLFCCFLTGCNQEEPGEELVMPTAKQTEEGEAVASDIGEGKESYLLSSVTAGSGSNFLETDSRFYTVQMRKETSGGYLFEDLEEGLENSYSGNALEGTFGAGLYYSDREKMEWKMSCQKRENGLVCDHKNLYCNSILSFGNISIGMYENAIYFASFEDAQEGELVLFRCGLNGEEKEKLYALPFIEGGFTGGVFHNGYYFYYVYTVRPESGEIEKEVIYQCSLKDGTCSVILEENNEGDFYGYQLYPRGNQLYLVRKGEEENRIFQYDFLDGTLEMVLEHCPKGYFYPREESFCVSVRGEGVYEFDKNTKEQRQIVSQQEGEEGIAYPDEDYYYSGLGVMESAREQDRLVIYDHDGETVCELPFPQGTYEGLVPSDEATVFYYEGKYWEGQTVTGPISLYYFASTEDKVFFTEATTIGLPTWYLEKKDIGTEALEWKQIGG